MVNPITPQEVVAVKQENFPEEVINSFNLLIASNWHNGRSTVKALEVADKISEALQISRDEVYQRQYLDVEEIYREVGWKVTYDQPAYNESYDTYFVFQPDNKKGTDAL